MKNLDGATAMLFTIVGHDPTASIIKCIASTLNIALPAEKK